MQRWKYSCAKVLKRVIKLSPKRRIFRSCLLRQFLYIAFAKHMLSKPCLLLGKPPLGFDKSPPPFAKKRRVFCPKRGGCFGVKVGGVLFQKGRVFFLPTSQFPKVWPKNKIFCTLYRSLEDLAITQKHLDDIYFTYSKIQYHT